MSNTPGGNNLKKFEDWKIMRDHILQMGGAKEIEARHKKGQMTARERVDYFFDPGTFTEIGMWVKHRTTVFGMDKRDIPADGIVTGFGKVNGRHVVTASEDYTCMSGSFGEQHGKKFAYAIDFAKDKGWPFVSMNDSGGLRMQEGMDALEAYGWLFHAQDQASGIIPQISLLLGPCLGGQAYHPVMQDFIIQNKKTGFMGIAGPAFVKAQTGEEIALEKLCGYEAHAVKSGQTHIVAEDDKDCLNKCKELLSFFPSSNKEKPPQIETKDATERESDELLGILPGEPFQIFNMYEVIERVVDDGYFFEILGLYAKNMITGFARFGGRPVGIVANQPNWLAGAIDINASDKASRFIRFCDLFNIPLVTFVDCPAYMIGSQQDWAGILRHGAKLLFAWSNATVPLISIIVRKSYAGAHYGMLDKSIGADFVYAWPTAIVTALDGKTVASVIFAKEIREAKNPEELRSKRIDEYNEIYSNPYIAAARGFVDDVIDPKDTRKIINRSLDVLDNKWKTAYKSQPWRKYSNITL
ncbi:MAG: methylmalonyl-CoA carboxyltransferase [Deltaproteobacteria bacterium CG12_big_fil_rev_8_21_14_0_65_43_10]|nr:MAG: methylmalonyl-CoA carboxyltransferase [Deltaproteobacteria bacterium CG12_big_fil_rev_8_21_14_0_65_43_10]PIU84872.1 MAG: methylmalonyl-CoA carboxyltransferase [Deltaproteobacteria bacterium CG06_land_8_20_14_3_00_44_19]PIX23571.1 MAG: methylmalonyl-CoA carboxyltransferase [Deltaproteobacteria bacterium CG_4_8_14_3_um_filter_43_13]PIZ20741.1 MAG: methylmalonyl-CoA carboxyltransferase [Deltaproteobacteria bacterium CG_4_10_14_0_8_um_filter_43_12]PJB40028.1 MAG: methylmalonyl-CoA carboxylt